MGWPSAELLSIDDRQQLSDQLIHPRLGHDAHTIIVDIGAMSEIEFLDRGAEAFSFTFGCSIGGAQRSAADLSKMGTFLPSFTLADRHHIEGQERRSERCSRAAVACLARSAQGAHFQMPIDQRILIECA